MNFMVICVVSFFLQTTLKCLSLVSAFKLQSLEFWILPSLDSNGTLPREIYNISVYTYIYMYISISIELTYTLNDHHKTLFNGGGVAYM